LKGAGGLSPEAFADGAYLKRQNERNPATEIAQGSVAKIQEQLKDTTGILANAVLRPFDQIPLDLNNIMAHPAQEWDLVLKPGDELYVPRNDEEISVSGEILFPTQIPFNKNRKLQEYISDAGGFTDNARKSKVYVLYPNGRAVTTRRFLFIKNYPEVKPGSRIIVPKVQEKIKSGKSTAETIGIASAIASLAGVVIAILNLVK
jgi:protein involved in polysaccharide export with SLBB domain